MTPKEFIESIKPAALKLYQETGILPSLSISQAALESGWGKSTLAQKEKNLFGIKGIGTAGNALYSTNEYSGGNLYTTQAGFRKYNNFSESLADYGNLLSKNSRYAPAVSATDWTAAAAAMGNSGYATDPNYGNKLKNIMQDFKLYDIDREAKNMNDFLDVSRLGTITSFFGKRNAPTAGASTNHLGVDIVLKNDDVPSIFSGVVSALGFTKERGNYITVTNSGGYSATYQHLAAPASYIKGMKVSSGDILGTQGSTGVSTGKHLHLEVKKNGEYINPLSLLPTNYTNSDTKTDSFSLLDVITKPGEVVMENIKSFATTLIVIICGLALIYLGLKKTF